MTTISMSLVWVASLQTNKPHPVCKGLLQGLQKPIYPSSHFYHFKYFAEPMKVRLFIYTVCFLRLMVAA